MDAFKRAGECVMRLSIERVSRTDLAVTGRQAIRRSVGSRSSANRNAGAINIWSSWSNGPPSARFKSSRERAAMSRRSMSLGYSEL